MSKPLVRISLLIVVFVACIFFGYRFLIIGGEQRESDRNPKPVAVHTEPIVVAAREVTAGKVLEPADLQEQLWPKDLIPAGSSTEADPLVGRVVRASLVPGIPIFEAGLLPSGASPEMSWRIEPGYRAMSLETNVSAGLAGFAVPGSRVDVLALLTSENAQSRKAVTTTIVQNVRVLAVDQAMTRDPDADEDDREPADVITLEVSSREAERLFLALSQGEVHLVLRSAEDSTLAKVGSVEIIDLLRIPGAPTKTKKKSTKRPRTRRRSVTIIRGLDRAGASF